MERSGLRLRGVCFVAGLQVLIQHYVVDLARSTFAQMRQRQDIEENTEEVVPEGQC